MFAFYFLFILFAIFKKKKKKKRNICGIYIFFDEPRSSQAIKPLSWDPESQLSQDPSLWAIESWSDPLSHDPTKPSQDLLQATIRQFEPLSWDTSHRPKLSWAAFWILLCYQTQSFTKITLWVWGGMLRNKFHCISHCLNVFIIIYSYPI